MNKYGSLYKSADFIKRLIPKNDVNDFIHRNMVFLQELDKAQEANPLITLSLHAGDGIWIFYKGKALFFVKPAQKHLTFHIFEENPMSNAIERQQKLFTNGQSKSYAYKVWRIHIEEMKWIAKYINEKCPPPSEKVEQSNRSHSRYIPGEIRQAVLEKFIREGRRCNGVAGIKKKHVVTKQTTIEFDHILPHSVGGSNTFYNVQVLCKECNRIKRASAK